LLVVKNKDPNRIEQRFDEADYARIERARPTSNALDKQDIGDADLKDAEKADIHRIGPRHGR